MTWNLVWRPFFVATSTKQYETHLYTSDIVVRIGNKCCCFFAFRLTEKSNRVMNFGSYNYLGFAEKEGPCKDAVEVITSKYGISSGASRQEMGMVILRGHLLPTL